MELNEFVAHFAEQFDDTDPEVFTPATQFHDLDEWSSLVGLAVLNMVAKKCGVRISPDELKAAVSIQNVYDLVMAKKNA